jgi:uncharacterized Zn finger protein (UPF0148 family)
MSEPGKVACPKCEQTVDVVDGEYARHYVVMNVICTMSKRELQEEKTNGQHP